jgi:uncharacterized protein YrzB (UPF0473 family)
MADDEMMDGGEVVVMQDEDGTEYYYQEDMRLTVGTSTYALLSELPAEDGSSQEDGGSVARVVKDGTGEEEYVTDLTDEEFAAVQAAYDCLLAEDEEEN